MSVTHSENLDQLAAALVKAQGAMKSAIKDSENPFFKSRYADLASVWEACREALTSNGLSVVQLPGYEPGAARLTTMLLHTSGQWIAGMGGAPLVPKVNRDGKESPPDAQSMGSAITYLRRYGLAAVAGVVQEDDDAEQAVRGKPVRGKVASGDTKDAPSSRPPTGAPDLTTFPEALKDDDGPLLGDPKELEMPVGKNRGAKLGVLSSAVLLSAKEWMLGTKRYAHYVEAIETILKDRGGE
jgi:ERF superfamily protein